MDGWRLLPATAVLLALGPASVWAEREADYALPSIPQGAAAVEPAPAPRRAASPSFYAAGAAKSAVRLSPDEREERTFIRMAAAAGRFEVQASRLALSKSGNARVRALAQALIDQHRDSQLELAHLLQGRDMAMPMLDNAQSLALKRLTRYSGTKFDRDYLDQVGRSHRESIRGYEKASAGLKDAHLRAWADQKLPALRVNLLSAERAAAPGTQRQAQGPGIKPVTSKISASSSR